MSVPSGSEHYTFTNMRKNQYEEALFKCEDEKFEFDITINTLRKAIEYLTEVVEKGESVETALKKISKFKVVCNMFQGQLDE